MAYVGPRAPRGRPRSILHVAEAWGGGVQAVILDYVRALPEAQHLLLMAEREGLRITADAEAAFAGVWRMPPGHLARVGCVARLFRQLRPDVVHAHSSLAGGYVRLAAPIPAHRIVYTPHCYAMERADLPRPAMAAVWAAERALAWRTGTVAAVSPREAELARLLRRRQRAVHVPNLVPRQDAPAPAPRRGPGDLPELTVAAVGRLCAQKDPDFFAEAARAGRQLLPASNWVWLGGGEDAYRERLERAGVRVTGWLDRREVHRTLSQARVYAHTASWEGAPMTLLEAAALGLPAVARRIPALQSLGVPGLVETPAQLAAAAVELLRGGAEEGRPLVELFSAHNEENQRSLLRHVYGH
ncbi:glycosyltransferase [Streptomyces polyrhachis]|uniref:Glycosyltransferase n=1 Tax=Streptomyces polyrhachis TaxID=1282885 RepID=A0ABW2GPN9_9ACTN